jgi:hypothetical protein
MAQTTSGTSARAASVEYSTNGSSWTDMSGFSNKVDLSGGDRDAGETLTFDGDTPIVTRGKRKATKVSVSVVYTEGASEIQEVARAAHQNGTDLYLRWTVKGITTGNFRYTTSAGVVTAALFPSVDTGDAKAVMAKVEVLVSEVTKAAVP